MRRSAVLRSCLALTVILISGGASALNKDQPQSKQPAQSNAQPYDDTWPKPVETFLNGHYVDRADVVLTRRTGDITSSIIRWATNSPFSHAALVFTGPQFEVGAIERSDLAIALGQAHGLHDDGDVAVVHRVAFRESWSTVTARMTRMPVTST